MSKQSAEYHRAAAAHARKLRADVTTQWLKDRLEGEIAWHEEKAEEIERAFEPNAEKGEAPVLTTETPGR